MIRILLICLFCFVSTARADQPVVSYETTGATADDILQYDGTDMALKSPTEVLSNVTTDIDMHDLGDVSTWNNYGVSTTTGYGYSTGTCTTYSDTVQYVYGKNHDGWCSVYFGVSGIGVTGSVCTIAYWTITVPWNKNHDDTSERNCGSAYVRNSTTTTELTGAVHHAAGASSSTLRIYDDSRGTMAGSQVWNYYGMCHYRCAAP